MIFGKWRKLPFDMAVLEARVRYLENMVNDHVREWADMDDRIVKIEKTLGLDGICRSMEERIADIEIALRQQEPV